MSLRRWSITLVTGIALSSIAVGIAAALLRPHPAAEGEAGVELLEPRGDDAGSIIDDEGVSALTSCSAALADAIGAADTPSPRPAPRDAKEQIQAVAEEVERIRGHSFAKHVEPAFVSRGEMARRIGEVLDKELPADRADAEGKILAALGAIPSGTDFGALLRDVYGKQVAGFYDPDTKEIVVAGGGGLLSSQTRVVLSHEIDHALVDHAIGLPGFIELPPPDKQDAALAALGLVEGDATFLMEVYASALPSSERLGMLSEALGDAKETDMADVPIFIQKEIAFPYTAGQRFACSLYSRGGWKAVDDAYGNLPGSTGEVIFPERYLSGTPAPEPRDPGAPGPGWTRRQIRSLGAAELQWLFEAPPGRRNGLADARARAAALAAGEIHLWVGHGAVALGVSLVPRTGDNSLCDSITRWSSASFPGTKPELQLQEAVAIDGVAQDAVVICSAGTVVLGIAPDLATARAIAHGE